MTDLDVFFKVNNADLATATEIVAGGDVNKLADSKAIHDAIATMIASVGTALPTQTGNSGKYLTTDGTTASWGTPVGGGTTLPTQPGDNSFLQSTSTGLAWTTAGSSPIEGPFTPVVAGTTTAGSATYTVQSGNYQRIGNKVDFSLRVSWSGHTGTGNIRITGLPYVAATSYNPVGCYQSGLAVGAGLQFTALVVGGQSYIQLYSNNPAGSAAFVAMDAAGDVMLSGHYFV